MREPVRLPVLDHRHVSASAPTKWFVSVYGVRSVHTSPTEICGLTHSQLKGLIRNDDRKALAKALKLGNDQPYLFTSLQPVLGRWRCLLMYCNRDSAEIAISMSFLCQLFDWMRADLRLRRRARRIARPRARRRGAAAHV